MFVKEPLLQNNIAYKNEDSDAKLATSPE